MTSLHVIRNARSSGLFTIVEIKFPQVPEVKEEEILDKGSPIGALEKFQKLP